MRAGLELRDASRQRVPCALLHGRLMRRRHPGLRQRFLRARGDDLRGRRGEMRLMSSSSPSTIAKAAPWMRTRPRHAARHRPSVVFNSAAPTTSARQSASTARGSARLKLRPSRRSAQRAPARSPPAASAAPRVAPWSPLGVPTLRSSRRRSHATTVASSPMRRIARTAVRPHFPASRHARPMRRSRDNFGCPRRAMKTGGIVRPTFRFSPTRATTAAPPTAAPPWMPTRRRTTIRPSMLSPTTARPSATFDRPKAGPRRTRKVPYSTPCPSSAKRMPEPPGLDGDVLRATGRRWTPPPR